MLGFKFKFKKRSITNFKLCNSQIHRKLLITLGRFLKNGLHLLNTEGNQNCQMKYPQSTNKLRLWNWK